MPPSSALQVLICGCGAVTERFYVPALRELERDGLIRVEGLVDPDDARASHIGAQFPAARKYASLESGLTSNGADLVIVASPHQLHKEQTIASLRSGSHVLCEKPLALSSSDCDEMMDVAEQENRILGVGHFRRFFPSVQAIRSAILADLLGRPVSFAAFEGEIYRWPVTWPGSYTRGDVGGGVLADVGPHALDLLSWWLGDLRVVTYSDDAIDGIEINCRVELETLDGVPGVLRLSRDTVLPDRHVITFERGWLAYRCDVPHQFELGWNDATHATTVLLSPGSVASPMWAMPSSPVSPDPLRSFESQLRNIIDAINGRASVLASPRDARDGIALIEGCYASRTLSSSPWLDDEERREARRLFETSQ